MAAGSLNLTGTREIEAWSHYLLPVELVDEAGDPLNLSDFDPLVTSGAGGIRAQFRLQHDSPDDADNPLFDLQHDPTFPGGGIELIQPATLGQIEIHIKAIQTATAQSQITSPFQARTVPRLSGVWDAVGVGKVVTLGDYRRRLLTGTFSVSKGVTKFV